jgi:predicted nicotinamide N-methyase
MTELPRAEADPTAFIRRETIIAAPPLVPEIRLHLATEITPIWQATETTLLREGLPPPYWAFAWPGGQALARTILDDPAIVAGKRVLDFAAGSGLVAIAAAKAGARSVIAAEIDKFAASAIALNATLNGVGVPVALEDVVGTEGPWDLVLAGDVCYERPMAERVTAWLRRLVGQGTEVLMGDPGRSYLPRSGLQLVTRHRVPTSLELEDRTERETVIWRLLSE